MKCSVIMKQKQTGPFYNPPMVHLVFINHDKAKAACDLLNSHSISNTYWITRKDLVDE